MSLQDFFMEELCGMPVIDAHTHVLGHQECKPVASVMDLLMDPYIGFTMPFADRKVAKIIQDKSRPDKERWEAFLLSWPAWRCTGYGRVLAWTLRQWGFDDDNLRADMYTPIWERAQRRSPEESRKVYAQAGIVGSLTHYLGLRTIESERSYLDGSLWFDDGFYPLLGVLPLHEYRNLGNLEAVSSISGIPVNDLDSLSKAVRVIIDRSIQKGCVGFKEHRAYTNGMNYQEPDRAAASRDLSALLRGESIEKGSIPLSDYLFDEIVRAAIDHNVPIAMHTGYFQLGVGPTANVQTMCRIIHKYPEAAFDCYHLNYPYFEDHLAMIKSYPNLHANCCWAHIIDPAYTVYFLKCAIGAIPANHVFGFGADFAVLPEATIAHLELARQNIAEALAWAVERKMISRSAALELARMWLYENPKRVYNLEI